MDKAEIDKIRSLLKNNILRNDEFYGYKKEYNEVFDLLQKTVEISESNSALLIGPRGAGKTTVSQKQQFLITHALNYLSLVSEQRFKTVTTNGRIF